ncbi:hypothetical protein AB833_32065 [Chromatiales bacterium (ex Bugula neritina AB1)]|nr:hypothetical protein AB833_32065 [Chromatiales bacterium (ex Bugula neritina AB1)]
MALRKHFECVVSEAVGLRKPDKAIFELACDELNAEISSSIFIGDNPVSDIKGAKEAGLSTIYVPVECVHKPCEFADQTFYNLTDLADCIERKY